MKSEDGTIFEVFEWKSNEAMEKTHANPEEQKIRLEYSDLCEYMPVASVKEISDLFSNFELLN